MEIIKERTHTVEKTYWLYYEYEAYAGSGFSFECNEDGKVDEINLQQKPAAWKSYQACKECVVDGKKMMPPKIQWVERSCYEHAIGKCDNCNEKVSLNSFTNTCECGADYNMSGHLLSDRSNWGIETGESLSDILNIDSNTTEDSLE